MAIAAIGPLTFDIRVWDEYCARLDTALGAVERIELEITANAFVRNGLVV